jgi:hypothetical protein
MLHNRHVLRFAELNSQHSRRMDSSRRHGYVVARIPDRSNRRPCERSGCSGHRMPRIGKSHCQTPGAIQSYEITRAGRVEKMLYGGECLAGRAALFGVFGPQTFMHQRSRQSGPTPRSPLTPTDFPPIPPSALMGCANVSPTELLHREPGICATSCDRIVLQ